VALISGKVWGKVLLGGTDQWRGFGKGSSGWYRSVARFWERFFWVALISGKVLGKVLLGGTDQWRGFGKGSSG